jgi:hypothetical protein
MLGMDMVAQARDAIGLAVAAERYGARLFSSGATMGGILTTTTSLGEIGRKNLREAIEARHRGADNAHKMLLLEPGMDYTPTAANQRDSQFNELRVYQLREIARFFKIPVAMLGDLERATYSNHEQQMLSYYTSCLRPWLVNIKQELNAKLLSPTAQRTQYIEHVAEGFLRADVVTRGAFYTQMLDRGVFTINEVRELENRPPVDGGDVSRVPMNMEALPASAASTEDDDDVIEPQGRQAALLGAHRDLLVDAFSRMLRRQTESARKQIRPDKLSHFIEYFYDDPTEASLSAEQLRPAVRVWLTQIGSETDVATATDTFVQQHFAEQKRQLSRLASMDNDVHYQTALQKLMWRWEHDAPSDLANWLIQRGVTKHRQLAFAPVDKPTSRPPKMSVAMLERWHKTKMARQGVSIPRYSRALQDRWERTQKALGR